MDGEDKTPNNNPIIEKIVRIIKALNNAKFKQPFHHNLKSQTRWLHLKDEIQLSFVPKKLLWSVRHELKMKGWPRIHEAKRRPSKLVEQLYSD